MKISPFCRAWKTWPSFLKAWPSLMTFELSPENIFTIIIFTQPCSINLIGNYHLKRYIWANQALFMNDIFSKETVKRSQLRSKNLRKRSNAKKLAYKRSTMCLYFVSKIKTISLRLTKRKLQIINAFAKMWRYSVLTVNL